MLRSRMTWALALLMFSSAPVWAADEFRIETRLFSGSGNSPTASTTLFSEGEVFDYLEPVKAEDERDNGGEPSVTGEITVLQPTRKRFVILSVDDEMVTTLSFEQIDSELEKMRRALRGKARQFGELNDGLAKKRGRYFAFLADPQFTEQYSDETGTLLLSSEFLTYRVETAQPRRPGIADQVREYNDWQAKLNFLLHGSLSPYPRLVVNSKLGKRSRIAKAVTLTVSTAAKPVIIRAKHELDPSLRRIYDEWIEATRRLLEESESVSFAEYRRRRDLTLSQQAAKRKRSQRR